MDPVGKNPRSSTSQPFFLVLSIYFHLYACMHAKSLQLCPTLFDSMNCSQQAFLSMRFPRQEYWSGYSSVESLSHVQLFVTPWTTAHQASLSITNSQSLLKFMYIKSVMPSNHLILCCPLLLLPSIFPSIRVFSNESALRIRWPKYWSFSFSLGFPGHSAGKESACNAGDLSSIPGLGRSLGREQLPTPVFWPGEFHGLYSPWGHKKLEMTEQLGFSLSFSFSTNPSNEYSELISFRID